MLGRLLSLFRRRRLDAELDEELRHHLEALEAEHLARGLSAEEARLAATRDMGGIAQAKEAYRDQHGLPSLESLWRDVRLAFRSVRRTPGVTAAVMATLAIGIGASTAVFSVVDGVLLKPLPYPDSDALVSVGHISPRSGDELPSAPYLYFTYRDENRTLKGVGLWRTVTANVTGMGEPEQVPAVAVTSEILPILGIEPLMGRSFSRRDDSPESPPTVVLTYGYWQRRFGADPSVIGRKLLIDGMYQEVIGVMPRSFRFLDRPSDLIVPFQFDRSQVTLGRYSFPSLARLRPGVSLTQAKADVARLVPIAIDSFPPPPGYAREQFRSAPVVPHLKPLKQELVGDFSRMLWVLMAALGLVLLVACANVANLLLVRAEGRRQELAVRAALGAGWRRIARELLIESLVLAVLGGAAGVLVAYGGLKMLLALHPANLPRLEEIGMDARVLLFVLGASLSAGLLFGLLPVVKYANPRLASALRSGGRSATRTRSRHRVQAALVVIQVAIALVLLIGSGLMLRTFRALSRVPPGFTRPEAVQMVHVSISSSDAQEPEAVTRMQQEIVRRIGEVSGVESVALADIPPLAGGNASDTVLIAEGKTSPPGRLRRLRRFEFISPGFFRTLGIPLVAGRDLTWEDLYGKQAVALVSENLARDDWGSAAAALGKRVRASPDDPWREIVGVVGTLRDDGPSRKPPPIVYFPALLDRFWSQPTIAIRSATFVIRSPRAGRESFLNEIRQAVWKVNANLPLAQFRTLGEVYRRSMASTSFTLVMLAAAGGIGLLLGLIGIYGVIAYAVSQRNAEIAIRVALGAGAGELERMFVYQGVVLAGLGIAAGLVSAAALTRLMSSLLFGVSPLDPMTYTVVAFILISVAMLASYLPARRSARVDPVEALR
jgi:putative ABC transport system permease protein